MPDFVLLEIRQNFTPSMIHHCLGACERTHRTLAERLTPYIQKDKQWDNILPAINFDNLRQTTLNDLHSCCIFRPLIRQILKRLL
jgi:hypothetical protein